MADSDSRAMMEKTFDFFEYIGKSGFTSDFHKKLWYKKW
jgi:hypothetical protein